MSKLKELREQRAAAHAKAVEQLKAEKQTPETRASFDAAMADVKVMGEDISRIEAADAVEAEIRAAAGKTAAIVADPVVAKTVEERAAEYRASFVRAMRQGKINGYNGQWVGVETKDKKVLDREMESMRAEQRDINEGAPMLTHIGTYSGLGYFVPTGFTQAIEQATKWFAPLLDGSVLTILETATGNPLPMPTSNDTAQSATIVGEAAPVSEVDVTASQVNFAAYKFTSGLVKASLELLQDSSFDIEAWLSQRFGERFGRGMESYLTTGNGSNQPTGLLTAIEASGVSQIVSVGSSANDGVGAKNNTIGSIDLVNLEHGVDPSYRRGAKYMLHDLTLASLQQLLDKYGRPLWTPGVASNVPDTLNGYPYVINQSMPAIGSGVSGGDITMIFGDFKKYIVRKVKDLQVIRLDERYAELGQVGFISFARLDGNLLDAGTHPLNILVQHS